MIEQWLLNVNNCEQRLLTTVVDRMQHNIVEQYAAQHCNKLLTTLIKLLIFARVCVGLGFGTKNVQFHHLLILEQHKYQYKRG